MLEQVLDFGRLGPVGENLASSAKSLLELGDLEYYLTSSLRSTDDEYLLSLLSQFSQRFSELRLHCEQEPNLILQKVPIPAAPSTTVNVLGTLSPAVAA